MICCRHEHYAPSANGDHGFEVDGARLKYGRGVLTELGSAAVTLRIRRAGVFIDPYLRDSAFVDTALRSLREAGVDSAISTEIEIEPTDRSFKHAAAFAVDGNFDGFVSIGGGSTIDTAKAADLYATYPAEFMDYVNAPIGGGKAVPGPLKPHIACPTTSGTGSECTGVAIFDLLEMRAKTGIRAREFRAISRHHRSRRHAHVACDGRCVQRLRRVESCARIVHRASLHTASSTGARRGTPALSGRKSVQRRRVPKRACDPGRTSRARGQRRKRRRSPRADDVRSYACGDRFR